MIDRLKNLEEGINAFDNKDYIRAFSLLMPFAQSGVFQAQCLIATMYYLGLGVSVDGLLAVEWYQKAIEQGEKEKRLLAATYNTGVTQ